MMIKIFEKIATWRYISLFAGLVVFFGGYLFQLYEVRYEGIKLNPLDLTMGYNHSEVMDLFTKMEVAGRANYVFSTSVIDSVFPWMYGTFLMLCIAYFGKKVFKEGSKLKYLTFLPVAVILIDYFENFNTVQLLQSYPDISPSVVEWASTVTVMKWCFVILTLLWLIVVFALWLSSKLKAEKT